MAKHAIQAGEGKKLAKPGEQLVLMKWQAKESQKQAQVLYSVLMELVRATAACDGHTTREAAEANGVRGRKGHSGRNWASCAGNNRC